MAKGPWPQPAWGPESFLHVAGHQWLLQSAGISGGISASCCLWLLPLAPWGVRMGSSAVLLQKAFLESSPAYPAGKDCYPCHELRSWSCQDLALQQRTRNLSSAQPVALPAFEGCLAAISGTLLMAGVDSADLAGYARVPFLPCRSTCLPPQTARSARGQPSPTQALPFLSHGYTVAALPC